MQLAPMPRNVAGSTRSNQNLLKPCLLHTIVFTSKYLGVYVAGLYNLANATERIARKGTESRLCCRPWLPVIHD